LYIIQFIITNITESSSLLNSCLPSVPDDFQRFKTFNAKLSVKIQNKLHTQVTHGDKRQKFLNTDTWKNYERFQCIW